MAAVRARVLAGDLVSNALPPLGKKASQRLNETCLQQATGQSRAYKRSIPPAREKMASQALYNTHTWPDSPHGGIALDASSIPSLSSKGLTFQRSQ